MAVASPRYHIPGQFLKIPVSPVRCCARRECINATGARTSFALVSWQAVLDKCSQRISGTALDSGGIDRRFGRKRGARLGNFVGVLCQFDAIGPGPASCRSRCSQNIGWARSCTPPAAAYVLIGTCWPRLLFHPKQQQRENRRTA